MKAIFVALVSLLSANAMACPNLSGHFLCKAFTNDKDQDVTMAQNMENGVPVYTMTILVKGENPKRKFERIAAFIEKQGFFVMDHEPAMEERREIVDGVCIAKRTQMGDMRVAECCAEARSGVWLRPWCCCPGRCARGFCAYFAGFGHGHAQPERGGAATRRWRNRWYRL